jgi:flagellar basal-body rod protein FlgB
MNPIDPATLALVSKALDAATARQAVHASNIANASSEAFVPTRVRFEEHLTQVRDALARNEKLAPSDIAAVEMSFEPVAGARRVEIDTEVAEMARNALHYQALVKALNSELSLMSMAVSDGKR